MSAVPHLNLSPGEKVLDLCAAPGGKSTQIGCALKGKGLLVSNEIHPARAKALSSNIERLGLTNSLVVNEPPNRLADFFPEFFDEACCPPALLPYQQDLHDDCQYLLTAE